MLSSSLVVIVAAFFVPSAPIQSVFQPPTECGPLAVFPAHGMPEAQGRSTDLSIWALTFGAFEARKDIKIVWRITGTGTFNVRAYQPSGATTKADRVREHGGSTWQKPGDEWGTFFNFPESGCWDLHVTRGQSSGDLWIEVK